MTKPPACISWGRGFAGVFGIVPPLERPSSFNLNKFDRCSCAGDAEQPNSRLCYIYPEAFWSQTCFSSGSRWCFSFFQKLSWLFLLTAICQSLCQSNLRAQISLGLYFFFYQAFPFSQSGQTHKQNSIAESIEQECFMCNFMLFEYYSATDILTGGGPKFCIPLYKTTNVFFNKTPVTQ